MLTESLENISIIRLDAEWYKVRVCNLDISTQEANKRKHLLTVDSDDENPNVNLFNIDIVATEKLLVESNGDWEFSIEMCNVKQFKSREEFEECAYSRRIRKNEKDPKEIEFEHALESISVHISANMTYYLTHRDELEKDLNRKIDSKCLQTALLYRISELEADFNSKICELDSIEEEYLFIKDDIEKEKNRIEAELESLKKELLLYKNDEESSEKKLNHEIDLELKSSNSSIDLLRKELLYKQLCKLFGDDSQADVDCKFMLKDFHLLREDGNSAVATATRGEYYLIFTYYSS